MVALKSHVIDLIQSYVLPRYRTKHYQSSSHEATDIVFVNLIDKHGMQGALGTVLNLSHPLAQ